MSCSHQSLENRPCIQPVLFESNGATRTYVLNRASKLNALTSEMLKSMRPQLEVRVSEYASTALTIIIHPPAMVKVGPMQDHRRDWYRPCILCRW
jgi:hypothetical protein